jgi:hypothetical protein
MQALAEAHGWGPIAGAIAIMAFAGFTKGAVGFALPMIAISGIGSILPAPLAVAAVILPSLVTNVWQSLRQGFGEAWASLRGYWRMNAAMCVVIGLAAQLVVTLPDRVLFLLLGIGITGFSLLRLSGWQPGNPGGNAVVETGVGAVAGFFGGLAAVWGPPIVLYLLARRTGKVEMVRVQGLSYLLGSVVLTVAHGQSGLLDAASGAFSAWLILPAMAGMAFGLLVQDRLPQRRFAQATMLVLTLAGLNLLRRGLAG